MYVTFVYFYAASSLLNPSEQGNRQEQEKRLLNSSTLYIGNLSFYTSEEQILELFSMAGDVKRIVMGLDKYKKTPCGFCFVEYYVRPDAEMAMRSRASRVYSDRFVRRWRRLDHRCRRLQLLERSTVAIFFRTDSLGRPSALLYSHCIINFYNSI